MQAFGLVSLLITIALATWWLVSSGPVSKTTVVDESGNTVQESNYKSAIDSAHDAAEMLGGAVSFSGKTVLVAEGISVPDDTKILDLSNKNLSGSLKAEIRELKNLKELNISNNNFTGLPAEVGQLSQLEVLDLSNNPFTGLPIELGNLKNLKILDLRDTQYAKQDLMVIRQGLSADVKILID